MNLHSPFVLDSDMRYRVIYQDSAYRWSDRKTNKFLMYRDGNEALFNSLDDAIAAFVNGMLTVTQNERLTT